MLHQHLTEAYEETGVKATGPLKVWISIFTFNGLSFEEMLIQSMQVRITITPTTKQINITSSPIPAIPLSALFPSFLSLTPMTPPTWLIFLSSHPTSASRFTQHKTTWRAVYDEVRILLPTNFPNASPHYNGMSAGLPMEVLLYNSDGEMSEGTLTTPYYFRDGQWVTPALSCGGTIGTSRRWALENGLCKEGIIPRWTTGPGELVWLSIGVRGWGWGVIQGVVGKYLG